MEHRLLHIDPAKLCKGGEYMYRGNSVRSQICRSLPQQEIMRQTCPKGFHGGTKTTFEYTPISNESWRNPMEYTTTTANTVTSGKTGVYYQRPMRTPNWYGKLPELSKNL